MFEKLIVQIFKIFIPAAIALSLTGCANKDGAFKAVFTPVNNEVTWAIKDLSPGIPSNWEDYKYLLVEMRISTPQYFWFGFVTSNHGYLPNRITALPNTRLKMIIPLDYYRKARTDGDEMASLWGKPRITGKISTYGDKHGSLDQVDSIKIKMANRILKDQTFEIFSIKLTNRDEGEEIIEPKILIDKFGQWNLEDWRGKAHTEEELKNAWKTNDSLALSNPVKRDRFGGFLNTTRRATGFFRIEKINGKWWFIDPEGNLYLGTGVNGVRYIKYEYTPTHGREYIFKELPPEEFQRPSTRGYSEPEVSFTQWNLYRRYGEKWKTRWAENTVKRMSAWGMNLTNWSDTSLNKKIVYAKFLWDWGIQGAPLGIPDVYSPRFKTMIDSLAKAQCLPIKDDPWIIGYFTGNEPIWPGMESLAVDAVLKGRDTETKKALQRFLQNGDTPERRKEFIVNAYTNYLKMVKAAIRRYDPNHLILGTRLGGKPSDEAIKLARIFDVISVNVYATGIPKKFLDKIHRLSGKPVFIGEFHMGVPGRGLAPGLIQVANQKERAVGYRYYVENAFAHPAVIAVTWYKWRDNIATGDENGSNYNIGLVDITDRAYPELIESIKKTHKRIFGIHKGELKPSSQMAKGGKEREYIE